MRKSYLWAAVITLGLGGWMASPYIIAKVTGKPMVANAEETVAVAAPAAEKLFKVRVKDFTAIPRVAFVTANGITAASKRVDARARTSGTIMESNFRQGQSVKARDVLCRLDVAGRESQLAQAKATLASAKRDFEATQKLVKGSYSPESKLWSDQARLDAAKAALDSIETDMAYLEIKSPADGVLIEKPAEAGSLLAPGALCATVSTLNPLLVVVPVSEIYVPYVFEGMTAKATLVTGESVDGTVKFISKTADLATRTFRVELEVANPGERMREGVTAELSVGLPPQMAHKLPGSILILDDVGKFGVRVLNQADNTSRFKAVNVIAQDSDGMWVTGLPDKVTLVTIGQDYVRDGEKIEPVVETAEATQ
jgi:membrane fusion protein, multidrug efflux system